MVLYGRPQEWVEMEAQDKEKTAFTTCGGLWQFTVMPFELCNAPAILERLMDRMLAGLPPETALVYMDDILVPGQTFQQLDYLDCVFQRLTKAGLKLSPSKCYLFQRQVKYLGHVISQAGVSTDPEKAKAVANCPMPTNTTELKRFLGLCSYYLRFIAHITAPLHSLLQKHLQTTYAEDLQENLDRVYQFTRDCLKISVIE